LNWYFLKKYLKISYLINNNLEDIENNFTLEMLLILINTFIGLEVSFKL